MMMDEFTEDFAVGDFSFKGIWTDFDNRSPIGESGIITRVERILVNDDVAERISENSEILRLANSGTYLVKTSMRAGTGFTELDLERKPNLLYQGEF